MIGEERRTNNSLVSNKQIREGDLGLAGWTLEDRGEES